MFTIDAERIYSVGEIRVNYTRDYSCKQPYVKASRDAHDILRANWSDQIGYREEFYILCLGRDNEAIGMYRVSTGGVSGTVADPKIIFQAAMGAHASSIVLAHNHPSGNLTPSQADKDLTKKLKECGRVMECPVLDHLILSPDGQYLSFADDAYM